MDRFQTNTSANTTTNNNNGDDQEESTPRGLVLLKQQSSCSSSSAECRREDSFFESSEYCYPQSVNDFSEQEWEAVLGPALQVFRSGTDALFSLRNEDAGVAIGGRERGDSRETLSRVLAIAGIAAE